MTQENGRPPGRRRATVRFDGHVQGVGFRYTTVHIASDFDVTGYVQNEPDESVSLVVEGDERTVHAFLRAVKDSHVGRYVTGESCSWSPATGEFPSFTVRYGW